MRVRQKISQQESFDGDDNPRVRQPTKEEHRAYIILVVEQERTIYILRNRDINPNIWKSLEVLVNRQKHDLHKKDKEKA